jgi:hypothetical protein
MRCVVLLLAGYYLGRATATAPASPEPIITVAGHTYAVVRVERCQGEASNMGGTHLALSIEGLPPERLLHAGGHGLFVDDKLLLHCEYEGEAFHARYLIAEIALAYLPQPPICQSTWCGADQPVYYGTADHLVPATDLADARARLAAIPRTGYPRDEIVWRER